MSAVAQERDRGVAWIKAYLARHPIPPVEDGHEAHARDHQPSRAYVIVDGPYAMVDEYWFKRLPEYSASIPTGVWFGKMWKARWGDPDGMGKYGGWYLRWYGPHKNPKLAAIEQRHLVVVRVKQTPPPTAI